MNAFDAGNQVADRSFAVLRPFIEQRSGGRFVVIEKGALAQVLQRQFGDVFLNSARTGALVGLELKAEERHTGNLFVETQSNRNSTDARSFMERGATAGWLYTLRTDFLLYHFLDLNVAYLLPFFGLYRWCVGVGPFDYGNLDRCKCATQRKYDQLNESVGRLVPVRALAEANLVTTFYPDRPETWNGGPASEPSGIAQRDLFPK